ncbi:MAG: 16S rRNA (adenine(1518)-N(6)/adenine(1519)-N(6))-dimethyltransferase RsmA [Planctomycetota bacterium]|nr:16S rRNA (adenine(1518)-N(6)/adenine(1519)-N(6))-dimethyltransferase RsmA [Planctomycetota bacterium]
MTEHRLPQAEMSQPPMPPRQTAAYLKKWFAEVGFTIDARRGQNFLIDLNLLDLLIRSAAIGPDDVVLEVGAGSGTLTTRLALLAARVVSAEIDSRLAQLTREQLLMLGEAGERVELVEGDALHSKHRFAVGLLDAIARARDASPTGRFLLVANLPYCVATPVISNLLALPDPFDAACVTIQRELAERITARPGSSEYSGLSVWIGSQCRSEIVRVLPPSAFWPRPKVESAILRIETEPARRQAIPDLDRFHAFVRDVFCHRRKLLRGVLARMAGGRDQAKGRAIVDRVFAEMGLEPQARAEEIAPDAFVRLETVFTNTVCEFG